MTPARVQLVDALRVVADRRRVSDRDLATRLGVHRKTIRRMWRHETATDFDTVVGVARALGLDLALVPGRVVAVPNSQRERAAGLSIFSDSGAESERDAGGDGRRGPGDT